MFSFCPRRMSDNTRNVELLYEMGTLRFIPRIWRQFFMKDAANIAEHTFRVMWTAILIAKEENADINKVIKMALIHDIGESRTSDVHYLGRMYTKRNEEKAMKDILKGTSIEEEFNELFLEYEERKTLEAKIVKDADCIDIHIELEELYVTGITLKKDFKEMYDSIHDLLFTQTAKKLWREIEKTNPHSWHLNANNRFKVGDWKKKDKSDDEP